MNFHTRLKKLVLVIPIKYLVSNIVENFDKNKYLLKKQNENIIIDNSTQDYFLYQSVALTVLEIFFSP